jgi:predicted RNase H-like nuclease (RuvC/YqgF family)
MKKEPSTPSRVLPPRNESNNHAALQVAEEQLREQQKLLQDAKKRLTTGQNLTKTLRAQIARLEKKNKELEARVEEQEDDDDDDEEEDHEEKAENENKEMKKLREELEEFKKGRLALEVCSPICTFSNLISFS